MPGIQRIHAVVSGIVQGIGYRWFVRKAAVAAGLAGWVRNLPDGSVELEAEGPEEELEAFIETLKTGHDRSQVSRIDFHKMPRSRDIVPGFEIKS